MTIIARRCYCLTANLVAVFLLAFGLSAFAQDAEPTKVTAQHPASQAKPATIQPITNPTAEPPQDEPGIPSAVVIEVAGSVDWAWPGVSPLVDDGWTAVQLADALTPGTQIRTGLRSHVNLRFGDATVVSIRSATHASIDQFFRSATTETIRVGLAYGTVCGGSTEGPIKVDMQVDSTVATLAKRGTEGWQMWVEPSTGRFRVSLAKHGLVEAIQRVAPGRTRSKTVRPGEYATLANIANLWLSQAIFDRNVQFYAAETITVADAGFVNRTTRGVGVLSPGAGAGLNNYTGRSSVGGGSGRLPSVTNPPPTMVFQRQPLARPEGNFGTSTTFRILRPVK